MRNAALFLALAAAVIAAALAYAGPDDAAAPPKPPLVAAYLGSAACAECHPSLHARWSRTAHGLSIRDFTGAESARPFDGETFVARDLENRLGPGPFMETDDGPDGKPGKFPVEKVIGVRRVQMFTTTLPGGRIQVLPVFVEVPPKHWFDYADFIFGGPATLEIPKNSAYSWYGPHRNFSSRCVMCHMVDYRIGYDPDAGTYATTWKEQLIGCESCHGPGSLHIDKWRRRSLEPDPIVNPVKLPIERANEACAQCHSENLMVKPGFRPGDDLYGSFDLAGLEDERHLYPDGRAKELIHNHIPTIESRCGPIRCTKCHDPHGHDGPDGSPIPGDLPRPMDDDWTCTQCHADIAKDVAAHTHHKPESAGSRCVECHMPPLVIEGGHGRVRDHTISIPSIENTRRLGLPNACRTCHVTEEPGFEYAHFEAWYPEADKRNHRVPLARTIALGRARKPEAKGPLLELLSHPNPAYRAGAAALLAPYDVDLRPALADPHAFVRRKAVEGVARLHPEALEPLLEDPGLVLRRAAAIALASRRERADYDYIAARKELRARVLAVLEECSRERPDDADVHFLLGKLYSMDGRTDEANRALSRFGRLRPWMR